MAGDECGGWGLLVITCGFGDVTGERSKKSCFLIPLSCERETEIVVFFPFLDFLAPEILSASGLSVHSCLQRLVCLSHTEVLFFRLKGMEVAGEDICRSGRGEKKLDSISGDKVRVFIYTRSLRYSCTLLRSLKKSDASTAVRPVMVTSFFVWMVFAGELSVMDFNFSFGCSKSKAKNCE